jgi:hypothetical protein
MLATPTQRAVNPPKALERQRKTLILQRRSEFEHSRFGRSNVATDHQTRLRSANRQWYGALDVAPPHVATPPSVTTLVHCRHPNLSSASVHPRRRVNGSSAVRRPCHQGNHAGKVLSRMGFARKPRRVPPSRAPPEGNTSKNNACKEAMTSGIPPLSDLAQHRKPDLGFHPEY